MVRSRVTRVRVTVRPKVTTWLRVTMRSRVTTRAKCRNAVEVLQHEAGPAGTAGTAPQWVEFAVNVWNTAQCDSISGNRLYITPELGTYRPRTPNWKCVNCKYVTDNLSNQDKISLKIWKICRIFHINKILSISFHISVRTLCCLGAMFSSTALVVSP
jgi:hypothetical protein